MVRVGRSAVGLAVVAAGVGCSLLTPLDYVGGGVGQGGGSPAGRAGVGGAAVGGGGSGAQGGGGDGTGGTGGTEVGGTTGAGGSSAEGGGAGEGGEIGAGEGGAGGASGGTSGTGGANGGTSGAGGADGGTSGVGGADGGLGGSAGVGGAAGGGMGGVAGCPGVNFDDDPENCGTCGNACGAAERCVEGDCVGSPCDGLCATFINVPLGGDGFRVDNIGTAEQCYEVIGYTRNGSEPTLVCWNFQVGRTLEVNGVAIACETEPGPSVGEPRAGGYCLKAGAGDFSYAGFKFPLP
jgi:hypothetical protein